MNICFAKQIQFEFSFSLMAFSVTATPMFTAQKAQNSTGAHRYVFL